jgi:hypothetical protein
MVNTQNPLRIFYPNFFPKLGTGCVQNYTMARFFQMASGRSKW